MQLWKKILIGFALGIAVGLVVGPQIAVVKPVGDLFIRLVKMVIMPLVFCSLAVGASSIGDMKKFGRIGIKTVAFFLTTTAFAIIIGLFLGIVGNPSAGFVLGDVPPYEPKVAPGPVEMILNLVPTNIFQALASDSTLQVIVFAIFVGIAIALLGEKGKPARDFFESMSEISAKIVGMVMGMAPFAVFALMAWTIGTAGAAALLPLTKVIVLTYIGYILHAVLVYGGTVWLSAKMSPLKFFKGSFEAMAIMFSTCAGMVALPTSMKCAQKLGVPKDISSFVQPLGTTINMDGGALYQAISACFIAGVYGIRLGMPEYVLIILTATLGSIGAAAVPGGSMIMLGVVLQSVGIPLDGIMLIAGIDRILDMGRTTLNCTGDIACAIMIAATEDELAS